MHSEQIKRTNQTKILYTNTLEEADARENMANKENETDF